MIEYSPRHMTLKVNGKIVEDNLCLPGGDLDDIAVQLIHLKYSDASSIERCYNSIIHKIYKDTFPHGTTQCNCLYIWNEGDPKWTWPDNSSAPRYKGYQISRENIIKLLESLPNSTYSS